MSKRKTAARREQDRRTAKRHSRRNAFVALGISISLLLAGAVLGQRRGLWSVSQTPPSVEVNPSPTSLDPGLPSKEFIHAGGGGRIIATEEGLASSITPRFRSFAASASSGSISVVAPAGQGWTATGGGFVGVPSGSGTGNGTLNYTVAANTVAGAGIRQGSITFSGTAFTPPITFTVYQGKPFTDVSPGAPYYDYIGRLASRGVTLGCGTGTTYCPNDYVNREQMAAFIIRALGDFNPPFPTQQRFTDVPPSNPFYAFIDKMAVLQITLGCTSPTTYCPILEVTHQEMAAFVMRAKNMPNPPAPPFQRFADVPPTIGAPPQPNPFYNYIDAYFLLNIWRGGLEDWTGYPGGACTPNTLFCPNKKVSRAQMAKILVTAFDL